MTAPTEFQAPGKMPEQLIEYWTRGEGAAKIRWGTDGAFDRCVRNLRKYFPRDPKGLCARLHKRATGEWPAEEGVESAADTETLARKCPAGEIMVDGRCVPDDADEEYALIELAVDEVETAMVPMRQRWRSMLAPIDKPTGDKRRFAPGSITHRDLPLPLLFQQETGEGHSSSVIVGRITDVEITDDTVNALGDWLPVPEMPRARELVDAGVLKPSVDLDDITYEIRESESGERFDPETHCTEHDGCKPSQFVITQGRIAGATLVSIPAFAEVTFESFEEPDEVAILAALDAEFSSDGDCGCGEPELSMVAATGDGTPDTWFTDPGLERYTPVYVTDEGRLVGHVAAWGVCHTEYKVCVTPPDGDNFEEFHRYAVDTANGWVKAGRLTVGYGRFAGRCAHTPKCNSDDHACGWLNLAQTIRHYDELVTFAYARAGKDEHGIWVSGVPVPDVDTAGILRRGVSGDWRHDGTELALVEVMAVSTTSPAFPAPRAHVALGRQTSLVAAGAVELVPGGGELTETAVLPGEDPPAVPTETAELARRKRRRRVAYDMAAEEFDTLVQEDRVSRRDALLVGLEG